jgi:hypothetical protein
MGTTKWLLSFDDTDRTGNKKFGSKQEVRLHHRRLNKIWLNTRQTAK